MDKPQRYRLKLKKLDFVSLVDSPAQPNATTLLIKRAPKGDEITATARFVKVSDELGLAFFWAFTCTNPDGSEHFDLQKDAVDQDFIKAAMEFMIDGGGAVDEMHDSKATSRVVFAFPMTPDIAKAFGVVTKTVGLMVAIKPTAEQLAKLKTGELNGVSIAGAGLREAVKTSPVTRKRRFVAVRKDVVLTDEVDGHQHAIDLDDPAGWCGDRLTTTQGMLPDQEAWHVHVWTFDPATGAVTIAADSGHTHTVSDSVPADVLAVFALNEKAEDAENATAVLERVLDGEPGAADVTISIAARAPINKSPPISPALKVGSSAKEHTVDPKDKQIADLTKRNERLERISKLSPAHFGHLLTLALDDADTFLAKSTADRDAIVQAEVSKRAAGDEVVYTSPVDGAVYRKSHDPQLVAMAKREAEAKAAVEKTEIRAIAKAHMAGMVGGDEVHDYIVASIRKGGGDAAMQTKAFQALKGASVAVVELGKPVGGNPDKDVPVVKSTNDLLRERVEKFQTDNKIPTYQQAFAKALREDGETQKLYAASKN